jgi:tripartite-type tricarboxylate transporter receptor subunit TctC
LRWLLQNVIRLTGEKLGMRLVHLLVTALALLLGPAATAQTAYPDRPIKMIVPLAAASAVDVAARIVTQKMADNMGQQIVILNLPGAPLD